jgi:hypothetical protein
MTHAVLVFDTTHHAIWAEQVAHGSGCAAEIEPAPAGARAKCALALAYLPEEESALLEALIAAGVPHRRYVADAPHAGT